MAIDNTQLILAVVRGILVTAVVYLVSRFFDTLLPKNSFFYRAWEKEEKTRKFVKKYYWLIGVLVFVINILILYFLYKNKII